MEGLPRGLLAIDADLDATAMAEAVWLAALNTPHRTGPLEASSLDLETADSRLQPPAASGLQPSVQGGGAAELEAGRAARPLFDSVLARGAARPGVRVRVPKARGLPDQLELARSLRPFRRRWPHGLRREFDLPATIEAYSCTGELTPVMRPAPERWFDLDLVVDDAPSVHVWDGTIQELATLLERVGVFRSVEVRRLRVQDGAVTLIDRRGRSHRPNASARAWHRTLVLTLSDFTSATWYQAPVWEALAGWARRGPVAIVNPLSANLWVHTGLDLPTSKATAAATGGPNGRLRYPAQHVDSPSLPIPVMTLSPHAWERWANMLMQRGSGGCEVIVLPLPVADRSDVAIESEVSTAPEQIVESFRHIASTRADRLAVLCSPFDQITLPLVHLLREELVPEASLGDIAELILCGLFELVPTVERSGAGAVELIFRAGVQEILQRSLTEDEAWRSNEALTRHITERANGIGTFDAVVHLAGGDAAIPEGLRPFARASRSLLRLLQIDGEEVRPTPVVDFDESSAVSYRSQSVVRGLHRAGNHAFSKQGFMYEAREIESGRKVYVHEAFDVSNAAQRDSFHADLQLLRDASTHPNIAPVLDFGITELGFPYVVQPFFDGGLGPENHGDLKQAIEYGAMVADALAFANSIGVDLALEDARDVKFTVDGDPVVCSFTVTGFRRVQPVRAEAGVSALCEIMRDLIWDQRSIENLMSDWGLLSPVERGVVSLIRSGTAQQPDDRPDPAEVRNQLHALRRSAGQSADRLPVVTDFTVRYEYPSMETKIAIKVGDLLAQPCHLVVGFSDTFDTSTDENRIISRASIQGQLLERLYDSRADLLDRELNTALRSIEPSEHEPLRDKPYGKVERYPIGTVAALSHGRRQIFAVAYSRMSNDLVARSSFESLRRSLASLWTEVRRHPEQPETAMPIIGSGLARVNYLRLEDLITMTMASFLDASRDERVCRELQIIVRPEDLKLISMQTIDAFAHSL